MVSVEQFKRGAINYIESELLPLMAGGKRILAATYVALAADNVEQRLLGLKDHPMIAFIEIFDEHGMIDVDKLHKALYTQMANGNITVQIPMLGELNFDRTDVDKLIQHVKGVRM